MAIKGGKAGILIDDWKLPIFSRHLDEAGYRYLKHEGLTEGTLLLTVVSDNMLALANVVKAAHEEADRTKGNNGGTH